MQPIIKKAEYEKYLKNHQDFIDDHKIWQQIKAHIQPDKTKVRAIIQKSLAIKTLTPDETATLINVQDPDLWQEMFVAADEIKKKVYDNRIVTFAPLYCSNHCLNNCLYCGFRRDNKDLKRNQLTLEQVRAETQAIAGKIGHKRIIAVYGEHPSSDIHYMVDTIKTIYSVKEKTKHGFGNIRRVNVNAAPMSVADLKLLKKAGIGTYQVFQETYHHETYQKMHPQDTIKGNYQWRLYALHRAFEAGIDDVAIGALFGLYDWRFEVMGLLYHAIELENKFGVGPHTISFPRLTPAQNAPASHPQHEVSDTDFKKLVTIIRLSVPYTGMIITAREKDQIKKQALSLGCTQTDASTKIGIGDYAKLAKKQKMNSQQFTIGDPRDLDTVVRELAEMGYITSFCTSGYRCGRTGEKIMDMLKCGQESHFCKINAILTFREWLDDFASPQTKKIGEKLIAQEIAEVKAQVPSKYSPKLYASMLDNYKKIKSGTRDLYI